MAWFETNERRRMYLHESVHVSRQAKWLYIHSNTYVVHSTHMQSLRYDVHVVHIPVATTTQSHNDYVSIISRAVDTKNTNDCLRLYCSCRYACIFDVNMYLREIESKLPLGISPLSLSLPIPSVRLPDRLPTLRIHLYACAGFSSSSWSYQIRMCIHEAWVSGRSQRNQSHKILLFFITCSLYLCLSPSHRCFVVSFLNMHRLHLPQICFFFRFCEHFNEAQWHIQCN